MQLQQNRAMMDTSTAPSTEVSFMSRPMNDEPTVDWKILLPAPLAGRIEYMLTDPVHNKPIYGARAKLLRALLENWIAEQSGSPPTPVPSLMELRSMGDS